MLSFTKASLILMRASDAHYRGNARYDPHKDNKQCCEAQTRQSDNNSNIHISSPFDTSVLTLAGSLPLS